MTLVEWQGEVMLHVFTITPSGLEMGRRVQVRSTRSAMVS
jgi:hypothetical protein